MCEMNELKFEDFLKSPPDDLSIERGRREFWLARRLKTEAEFVATQLVAVGGSFPRGPQNYPCRMACAMAQSLHEIAGKISEMGNPLPHLPGQRPVPRESYPWEMPRAVVGQIKGTSRQIFGSLVAADSGSPYASQICAHRLNEIAYELADVWAPYM